MLLTSIGATMTMDKKARQQTLFNSRNTIKKYLGSIFFTNVLPDINRIIGEFGHAHWEWSRFNVHQAARKW